MGTDNTNSIETLSTTDMQQWDSTFSLLYKVRNVRLVVYNNLIISIGAQWIGYWTPRVQIIDVVNKNILDELTMIDETYKAAPIVVDSVLYVFGGEEDNDASDAKRTWQYTCEDALTCPFTFSPSSSPTMEPTLPTTTTTQAPSLPSESPTPAPTPSPTKSPTSAPSYSPSSSTTSSPTRVYFHGSSSKNKEVKEEQMYLIIGILFGAVIVCVFAFWIHERRKKNMAQAG